MSDLLNPVNYAWLLERARDQNDNLSLAFAGVIQATGKGIIQPPNLGMGLPINKFIELLETFFPGSSQEICGESFREAYAERVSPLASEFDDIVELLLEHRSDDAECNVWVAHAVASGCMGSDHLYHDMGLPDRRTLSSLLECYFTTLFQKNTGNMKWKKFFYKQLCERAEVIMCPARNCQSCIDYQNCFGLDE
jgi:nitrogen fixation protein NifQ